MLISTKQQLIRNLDRIENYLSSDSDELYEAMVKYIARGRVFVAYKVGSHIHFAPSRFVGYKNNTLVKHQNNSGKHGFDTNKVISAILGQNKMNSELEEKYLSYCRLLNVIPSNSKRSYWCLEQDIQDEMTSEPFIEGKTILRTHLVRERNCNVVKEAKRLFKEKHGGRLYCEICGFDFSKSYGKIGEDFIEAHHKTELSKTNCEHVIKPSDFVMVCPNCHSMLHRGDVTIEKLKKAVKRL